MWSKRGRNLMTGAGLCLGSPAFVGERSECGFVGERRAPPSVRNRNQQRALQQRPHGTRFSMHYHVAGALAASQKRRYSISIGEFDYALFVIDLRRFFDSVTGHKSPKSWKPIMFGMYLSCLSGSQLQHHKLPSLLFWAHRVRRRSALCRYWI